MLSVLSVLRKRTPSSNPFGQDSSHDNMMMNSSGTILLRSATTISEDSRDEDSRSGCDQQQSWEDPNSRLSLPDRLLTPEIMETGREKEALSRSHEADEQSYRDNTEATTNENKTTTRAVDENTNMMQGKKGKRHDNVVGKILLQTEETASKDTQPMNKKEVAMNNPTLSPPSVTATVSTDNADDLEAPLITRSWSAPEPGQHNLQMTIQFYGCQLDVPQRLLLNSDLSCVSDWKDRLYRFVESKARLDYPVTTSNAPGLALMWKIPISCTNAAGSNEDILDLGQAIQDWIVQPKKGALFEMNIDPISSKVYTDPVLWFLVIFRGNGFDDHDDMKPPFNKEALRGGTSPFDHFGMKPFPAVVHQKHLPYIIHQARLHPNDLRYQTWVERVLYDLSLCEVGNDEQIAGVTSSYVLAIRALPEIHSVQRQGFLSIYHVWTSPSCSSNKEGVAKCGGSDALLSVMESWKEDTDIQENGLHLFSTSFHEDNELCDFVRTDRVFNAAFNAVAAHPKVESIQRNGLSIIAAIMRGGAGVDEAENSAVFVASTIASSMARFRFRGRLISSNGCEILSILMTRVVKVVLSNIADTNYQDMGCSFLGHFLKHPTLSEQCLLAVLGVLEAHTNSGTLQALAECFRVLRQATWNNADTTNRAIRLLRIGVAEHACQPLKYDACYIVRKQIKNKPHLSLQTVREVIELLFTIIRPKPTTPYVQMDACKTLVAMAKSYRNITPHLISAGAFRPVLRLLMDYKDHVRVLRAVFSVIGELVLTGDMLNQVHQAMFSSFETAFAAVEYFETSETIQQLGCRALNLYTCRIDGVAPGYRYLKWLHETESKQVFYKAIMKFPLNQIIMDNAGSIVFRLQDVEYGCYDEIFESIAGLK
ncbi:expressed unknown protein [Seminavis robusta]|uniref:Uncharacterized protein n=1 Tax=Seminavis robusta TaxID=568900 RepID=A0A9N8HSD4_9STRA|nr:expressed unknown protein [Seminavis robusta]|eukprot:Sro1156_g247270.1 n/a (879) ;mRNA; f:13563-16504